MKNIEEYPNKKHKKFYNIKIIHLINIYKIKKRNFKKKNIF